MKIRRASRCGNTGIQAGRRQDGKSILISAAVRLAPFNLPQIKAITDHDDMDLYTLGEKSAPLCRDPG